MTQPSFPSVNFIPSSMVSIRSRREEPTRDHINSIFYGRAGTKQPQYGISKSNESMPYDKTTTTASRLDEVTYNNNRTFEADEYNSNIKASGFLSDYDIKHQSRNISREFSASIKESYSSGQNDIINTISLRRQFQPIYKNGISNSHLIDSEKLRPLMDNYHLSYK